MEILSGDTETQEKVKKKIKRKTVKPYTYMRLFIRYTSTTSKMFVPKYELTNDIRLCALSSDTLTNARAFNCKVEILILAREKLLKDC